jgi:hypothetical protein
LDELPKVLSNRRGTKSKDEEALKAALSDFPHSPESIYVIMVGR